ncbi:MAG: adenylyl-sulfate kinase [Nitrosomonadales bacterium]|nr:MAG: adenylyl-sulfate kinase [Nitrosomonadales bacterium]
MNALISPYGGTLVNLMAAGAQREALLHEAAALPALILNARQLCDLELLLNGALSPLRGFMGEADFNGVVSDMRLADGTFWPLPIVLDVAEPLNSGSRVALKEAGGTLLAILSVSACWQPDLAGDPGAAFLPGPGGYLAGGTLEGLNLPPHADFAALRLTPAATRENFMRQGRSRVIAFQPGHVMHRAQYEFTRHCSEENTAALLIQAIASEEPNPDFFTRIRCLQALLPRYPGNTAQLGLLPLASRQTGVREVLWQAIVARNYGCSHFIIGGDAGAGGIRRGSDALTPERIQPLAGHFATLGIEPLTFPRMLYVLELEQYLPEEYLPPGQATLSMPARELQQRILDGREAIPEWASFPEVVEELEKRQPPRIKRGFTVFFTGLPGAGKTTISHALELKLMELTGRPVTRLDGDVVRTLLSSGLTYSRADRDLNIRRMGFVAAEITRQGGIALCAPIAPYRETRQAVRDMIEPLGGFFEVHVSMPLEAGEARDPKGLYAKARAGLIKEFTGVSDPYEAPHAPEASINTGILHVAEAVEQIVNRLRSKGYLN